MGWPATAQPIAAATALRYIALQRDPRFEATYASHLAMFEEQGLINTTTPYMHFGSAGLPSKYGSWWVAPRTCSTRGSQGQAESGRHCIECIPSERLKQPGRLSAPAFCQGPDRVHRPGPLHSAQGARAVWPSQPPPAGRQSQRLHVARPGLRPRLGQQQQLCWRALRPRSLQGRSVGAGEAGAERRRPRPALACRAALWTHRTFPYLQGYSYNLTWPRQHAPTGPLTIALFNTTDCNGAAPLLTLTSQQPTVTASTAWLTILVPNASAPAAFFRITNSQGQRNYSELFSIQPPYVVSAGPWGPCNATCVSNAGLAWQSGCAGCCVMWLAVASSLGAWHLCKRPPLRMPSCTPPSTPQVGNLSSKGTQLRNVSCVANPRLPPTQAPAALAPFCSALPWNVTTNGPSCSFEANGCRSYRWASGFCCGGCAFDGVRCRCAAPSRSLLDLPARGRTSNIAGNWYSAFKPIIDCTAQYSPTPGAAALAAMGVPVAAPRPGAPVAPLFCRALPPAKRACSIVCVIRAPRKK